MHVPHSIYCEYKNHEKEEIKKLKKQISQNSDIIDYYQKYHCLNDFLEVSPSAILTNLLFATVLK